MVLLDIRLPDGNGLDALPEIRRGEDPPEVIILTGLGDPDGAEMAISGGAWDYLVKPAPHQADHALADPGAQVPPGEGRGRGHRGPAARVHRGIRAPGSRPAWTWWPRPAA